MMNSIKPARPWRAARMLWENPKARSKLSMDVGGACLSRVSAAPGGRLR
jgi:hypothetical protein